MPMRWTPENDQTLLLKIIEVSNVSPDVRAIAELWPTKDGEERPTPRAITERLGKIRSQIRANGGNFSISGKGKGKAPAKDPLKPKAAGVSTPRKSRPIKKIEPPTPDSSTKIKRENDLASTFDVADTIEGSKESNSSNNSDGGSPSHEPLTPASVKRKQSFDVFSPDTETHLAYEAEDVPIKRQMMASPTPALHQSLGGVPTPMSMLPFGASMHMHDFQYLEQGQQNQQNQQDEQNDQVVA